MDLRGNYVELWNQRNYFESATHCGKRMRELLVATRLKYDLLYQVLLVSSTERACVCLTSQNCHIIPIGSQPRKSKGHFGGVVFSSVMSKVTKRGVATSVFISRLPNLFKVFYKCNIVSVAVNLLI